MDLPEINISCPDWVKDSVDWTRLYRTDEEKMRLAIELSRLNVARKTGGPFGAAIFEEKSGRLVSVGTNLVVPANNSVLHAEIVAFMMAQAKVRHYSLNTGPGGGDFHTLAASCEPCAMCLGATLWSGVSRLLCGAGRADAQRLDFDEGPVFDASYEYLRERGIEIVREVCRAEAAAVLENYRAGGGRIYNR